MKLLLILALLPVLIYKTEGYDLYPYNPKIHTLGNHGILGKLHAEIAPIFIGMTDRIIYNENIRQRVIDQIGPNKSVLDIGCGVGISTSNSQGSMGIDTSKPMIEKARKLFPKKKFAVEINGRIISKIDYKKKNLKNNDKVEIVHFIGGG